MSNGPLRPRRRIPLNIDVDRLINIVLTDVQRAAKEWKNGRPLDEAAFMNNLTRVLGRKRRGCDVGKTSPMRATSQLYYLHREETDSSDKYGADLAVTLRIGKSWTKTAIFQLKKTKDYKCTLDKADLKAADEDKRISERSFLLAIDEDRLGVRLEKIQGLQEEFMKAGKKRKVFHASGWSYLSDWLRAWLRCELSPLTSSSDPNPVEGLLEAFRWDGPEPSDEFDFEPADVEHLESVPAESWLKIAISKS